MHMIFHIFTPSPGNGCVSRLDAAAAAVVGFRGEGPDQGGPAGGPPREVDPVVALDGRVRRVVQLGKARPKSQSSGQKVVKKWSKSGPVKRRRVVDPVAALECARQLVK
jgi:hypothetical protein